MAGARIYSYAYSEGPAAKLTVPVAAASGSAPFQAVQTLCVIEQATPGTRTYARPAAPTMFLDLLTTWATSLSAAAPAGAPAGTYAVTYNATTRRVTIASTNGTSFRPSLVGCVGPYLGFSDPITTGWETSWTGDAAPLGTLDLVGATIRPAEDASKVTVEKHRHGRAWASAWGNVFTHDVTIMIRKADAPHLTGGWCLTGRIRVHADATNVNPYSATNPTGWVDGFVVSTSKLLAYGASEDLLAMDLTLATPRG